MRGLVSSDIQAIKEGILNDGIVKIVPSSASVSPSPELKSLFIKLARETVDIDDLSDLNLLHRYVPVSDLNTFRLQLISKFNARSAASDIIYNATRPLLRELLGNDIAIQKNIGLSIQYPNDASSLLPIHNDVLDSDCSPYELVIWIPLVNCYSTKSMYFLPFGYSATILDYLGHFQRIRKSSFSEVRSHYPLESLDIDFPSYALFSHSIWHGNTINLTEETRISLNVRVKNVFTPYRGKRLGDTFKIANISEISSLFINLESFTNG